VQVASASRSIATRYYGVQIRLSNCYYKQRGMFKHQQISRGELHSTHQSSSSVKLFCEVLALHYPSFSQRSLAFLSNIHTEGYCYTVLKSNQIMALGQALSSLHELLSLISGYNFLLLSSFVSVSLAYSFQGAGHASNCLFTIPVVTLLSRLLSPYSLLIMSICTFDYISPMRCQMQLLGMR
jgi:hypothetical protein